jgi:hypothetical protein
MKVADLVVSWLIIFMGVLHASYAPHALTADTLWFLSGSVSLFLAGAINLLRSRYGHSAGRLRFFCVLMNIALAGFALVLGKAEGHLLGPPGIVAGLFVLAAGLSVRRGAPKEPKHDLKPAASPPSPPTKQPPISPAPGA